MGVKLTEKELAYHLRRGRDPIYFSEEILGVKLNPAQRRWFRLVAPLALYDRGGFPAGWQWVCRRVVHVAANQIGKTLGLSILLLWAAHYKIGINPENWDFWLSSPYKWYHLAPTHQQALYTLKDMRMLLQGAHPAQYDRETGERRPIRYPEGLATETKFDSQYPGIKMWNGAEIHFRTSDEKAKALQGIRAHGISFDEAAYEDHLLQILHETISMRLISTGGPLWMVSTPNGLNDYYEVVQEILQVANQTFHERVWEAPAKRWSLVWSHISDNVGYGLTEEDVAYKEEELEGKEAKEQALRGAFLEPADAYFTPSEAVKRCWVKNLRFIKNPEDGHRYVIFWDVSVSSDPTAAYVFDITKRKWRLVHEYYWAKPMAWPTLRAEMLKIHRHWNTSAMGKRFMAPRAITGFDATSMGGQIIKQDLEHLSPKRAVNFAGNVKRNALTNMRALLTKNGIEIPGEAIGLQREVLNYREKDDKLVQDRVMAFAGAAQVAAVGFSGTGTRRFDVGVNATDWRQQ